MKATRSMKAREAEKCCARLFPWSSTQKEPSGWKARHAPLVDWKSNLLGGRIEDYGQGALAGEIFRRQYYFQYQLYTVALDRYLRLRLCRFLLL